MTECGISSKDWDTVMALACEIINYSEIDDEVLSEHYRVKLFERLDELDTKYGETPATLSTRADFTFDDDVCAMRYLEKALSISKENHSKSLTLQSLITLMIENKCNSNDLQATFKELKKLTIQYGEEWDLKELAEYESQIELILSNKPSLN